MRPVFSWWFLPPVLLVISYSLLQFRTVAALGFPVKKLRPGWIVVFIAAAALLLSWMATGFPLPLLYVLTYCVQAASIFFKRRAQAKTWFLLNLSFINMVVLHLASLGVSALVRRVPMHLLLADAGWRAAGAAFVMAVCVLESLIFLRCGSAALFSADAESEEVRAFMAFLWLAAGYLLLDSLLCVAELPATYPPLFLVCSGAVLMFCLICFLLRAGAILREEHLQREHDALAARLEAARESAGALRRMADRDLLTGVYSRRYILGRIDALVQAGQPFSLAFLDLDGLKALNDSQGHDAGDRHLIRFSREMESRLRAGDLLARVGGDEFIVLLPGCGAEEASGRVGEIRKALGEGEPPVRFSFGVTALPPGARKDGETLLREADEAMYRDKVRRR